MSASPAQATPLPRLLVSVRDPAEAEAARLAGADLVDAKDPERGALGALDTRTVREIVARVSGGAVTSAVAEPTPRDVDAMAASGVDWVKTGIGPARRGEGNQTPSFGKFVSSATSELLFFCRRIPCTPRWRCNPSASQTRRDEYAR